jgi:hypothetical protein
MWVIMEQVRLNIIFKNILEVDIVQLIILFNKHTKIHLNDRKYQICRKILKTHIVQLVHILLHENVLGVYMIFFTNYFTRVPLAVENKKNLNGLASGPLVG